MGSQTPVEEGLFSGQIFFVSKNDLKDGPNTPGQNRKTALSPDGLWVGECVVTAYDQPSQWHHHKDYDSVMYMLSGRIRVDWGPNGRKEFRTRPGRLRLHGPQGDPSGPYHRVGRRLPLHFRPDRPG